MGRHACSKAEILDASGCAPKAFFSIGSHIGSAHLFSIIRVMEKQDTIHELSIFVV